MTDRYAVFGHPVSQSLSPRIHGAFAAQSGQRMQYTAEEVPLDGFRAAVARFVAAGGRGLNVTVPFKIEAFELVDEQDPAAAAAGAVNTIRIDAARLVGYNTDGAGLVTDLECNLGITLGGARLVVLGAGGAVQGVVGPLLAAGVSRLVLVNRTRERAEALAGRFDGRVITGAAGSVDAADVIVNGTSAGLTGDPTGGAAGLPEAVVAGALCYDMLYGADTPFCRFARALGARAVDGLGMLVEQAALAFAIWRGRHPETAPVLRTLRAELGSAGGPNDTTMG